jgi:hypothetical protein
MNLEQYIQERNNFTDIKDQYKKKIETHGQEIFRKFFEDYFKKYDFIKNITWTQYTPWFNDGEPCRFSVAYDYTFNEYDGEGLNLDENISKNKDRFLRWYDLVRADNKEFNIPSHEIYSNAYNDLNNFMAVFDKEDFLTIFGDHAKVFVETTQYGVYIEVQEYEHE